MIATTPPPPVALAVSPSRVVVAAGQVREITVTNRGDAAAVLEAKAAGLALGLRGRPRILARGRLVALRPRHVAVPPHGTATIAVAAVGRRLAGERPALVLLSSRAASGGLGVSLRIGVVVLVRGAGRVVHRLVPFALRTRGARLELWLRNAGTVAEELSPSTVQVRLVRRGRVIARARPVGRLLLPHTRGVCPLRYGARLDGTVHAVVHVAGATRVFRIRLHGRR